MMPHASPTIAILHQALEPPVIDGQRKDAKPGGYSDSGADIAFCLRQMGLRVLTPVQHPSPARDLDWVFPDTREGIAEAIGAGATLLWANTVLFEGHPIEVVRGPIRIVGQRPAAMQAADDKFFMNARLRASGLPTPASILAALQPRAGVRALASLNAQALAHAGLKFPAIIKPIRGRGSQGVELVRDVDALRRSASALIEGGRFGGDVIIEEYLPGDELTVTVMPLATQATVKADAFWPLPPVLRFNHANGVAPYNGVVAVSHNSRALAGAELKSPQVLTMLDHCMTAARIAQASAPIRIDCRGDAKGVFRLFDLNMKPNMTGAGRPGRQDQDGLSLIAARAIGWSFGDLLKAIIDGAWTASPP